MYLQRLLQVNMATLVALGTLLLGMGQDNATLPLAVFMAAIASVWLTDVTGWFRLSRTVVNLAALVAVAVSLRGLVFSRYSDSFKVLEVVNVLVYLQIILLFREKDQRAYWQLTILSLFQVVVAAALFQGVWFGVLLIVYMALGFSTLALMCLSRQWNRYRGSDSPWQLARETGRRWPLAGQESLLCGGPVGRSRTAAGRELYWRLGIMGLGTLGLTLFLFFVVPRSGRKAYRAQAATPKAVVGFTSQVTLGELGSIIESREEVMRVRLQRYPSHKQYEVRGDLYLRGAILTHYRSGQWTYEAWKPGGTRRLLRRPPPQNRPLILQQIEIEPLKRRELFCIWPFVTLRENDGAWFNPQSRRLERQGRSSRRRLTYELGTTPFVDGVQTELLPCDEVVASERLVDSPLHLYPAGPPGPPPRRRLPMLEKQAEEWVQQSRVPAADRLRLAQALAWRLCNSQQYQYTLEGQERDPALDPIEDFIANNKRGHCEYFATALTLMLHSQGIPARMVVGYKCDEWNSAGGYYKVRQLHAHAWVEAYFEREHIPEKMLHGDDPQRWAAGGWLRLEPTPGALGRAEDRTADSVIEQIERRFHWLQDLWADYVMEMDRKRQREAIYRPLIRGAGAIFQMLRDFAFKTKRFLTDTEDEGEDGGRPNWTWGDLLLCGSLGLIGALVLVLLVRCLRRVRRRGWRRSGGRIDSSAEGDLADVEFYRRLEALLATYGLVRTAGQTQREFAAQAGARIAATSGRQQIDCLPRQVAAAFYQVRFGGHPLDSSQAEAVEHALSQLAGCNPATQASSSSGGLASGGSP